MAYVTIPCSDVIQFCNALFGAYGFTREESRTITDVVIAGDLFGFESHGVQRLIRYHHEIQNGMVKVGAKPEICRETPISASIDAHGLMGQLAGVYAMNLAINKACASGIGMVTVRNSNHFGAAGYYTKMCADKDLIGVCMTNTESIMVPTFGRMAMLGTDPISVSMPAAPTPFIFDAATTVVPRGKLEVYNKREKPLPEGWALDAKGLGTANAGDVIKNIIAKAGGGILPLGGEGELNGGYKGYGFALICELFTGILAGGPTANHISSFAKEPNLSQAYWAIDYGIFGDKAEIRRRFSAYLAAKSREGISINEKTLEEMRNIGKSLGIDIERYFTRPFTRL